MARATNTNTPAARMRFTRLMRKIEESLKNAEEEGTENENKKEGTKVSDRESDGAEPAVDGQD